MLLLPWLPKIRISLTISCPMTLPELGAAGLSSLRGQSLASNLQSPARGRAGSAAPIRCGELQASPSRSGNPTGRWPRARAEGMSDVTVRIRYLTRALKVQGKSQSPLYPEKTEVGAICFSEANRVSNVQRECLPFLPKATAGAKPSKGGPTFSGCDTAFSSTKFRLKNLATQ